ncbi:hypothetical protein B0H34DRAFT_641050, partial [Crassisporium funariophilum]
LLLWIRNSLTPDKACKAFMDPTSPFQRELVQYLEAVHQGGSITKAASAASQVPEYRSPIMMLPEPPPDACPEKCTACDGCKGLESWWSQFSFTVNDILFKSNIHTCRSNKDSNNWGTCCGRFPWLVFKQTEVNPATGSLNIKKLEAWINTVSAAVSYLFWCNTDVTSLRLGTAMNGIMYYVTKYVTKMLLKTHVIFDRVCSVFQK